MIDIGFGLARLAEIAASVDEPFDFCENFDA